MKITAKDGLLLILGMAVVTYLPRLLPMFLFSAEKLPSLIKRFLDFIPYAVLTTLIFPEILSSTAHPGSALAGGFISLLLAYYQNNLFLVVAGGIGAVFLCELLF
ncbi:MAG TPA: AzlD domain-containing protein [Firmicutes bacterium]|jgi:branched-subunit amino acid transport protein|nr:AzlD domain-containing protein [Bacillota bacterium]